MGNNLIKLRKARKIKVSELAEKIDITAVYYYELERGDKRLNEDLLRKFAKLYNVTTDYILGIVDEPDLILVKRDNLPTDIKEYYDSLIILKDAYESGLTKEQLIELIEMGKKLMKSS